MDLAAGSRSFVRRVIQTSSPFPGYGLAGNQPPYFEKPQWPARWIGLESLPPQPFVAAYRLVFDLERPVSFRAHITGDERYELFLDGVRIGRGPARSPLGWWYFETFEFEIPAGRHSLAARVWSLGGMGPWAQLSFQHGFLFAPEPEQLWDKLATGRAAWRGKLLPEYTFVSPTGQNGGQVMGMGSCFDIAGARRDWHWESEAREEGWSDPKSRESGNSGFTLYISAEVPWLRASELPAPLDEPRFPPLAKMLEGEDFDSSDFLRLGEGKALRIEPQRKVKVVFDWCDYVAAYSTVDVSGGAGAVIRVGWCEWPADKAGEKIEAKTSAAALSEPGEMLKAFYRPFAGIFDTFRPDGGQHRVFEPLWWRCGRFVFLEIETADEALIIESLRFRETRYPFVVQAAWQTGDLQLDRMFAICRRTAESCAHETFMDCPYWEQLQYAGDTRLQILLAYVLSGDDVLARRALRAFAASCHNRSGWPPSSHPGRAHQNIPTFAFSWIGMLHDFALWRGDPAFVREIMPAARAALELWLGQRRADGLVTNPAGWNFLDSTGDLEDLPGPVHGAVHWLLAGALRQIAELEEWLGEPELATRASRLGREIAAISEHFWDNSKGLYADDLARTRFSEHTNAFSILSGQLTSERRLRIADTLFDENHSLTRTQIYASHYLFEAATQCRRTDLFWRRIQPWRELADQGCVTTPEKFGSHRSECHAWGAHPLFHLYASIAGVRPGSFGFNEVKFEPQPGPLQSVNLTMAHPAGLIEIDWSQAQSPRIVLPSGIQAGLSALLKSRATGVRT